MQDILALRECPSLTNVDVSYNSLCFHDKTGAPGKPEALENTGVVTTLAPLAFQKNGDTQLEERHYQDGTYVNQRAQSGHHVMVESRKEDENSLDLAVLPTDAPTAVGEESVTVTPHAQGSRGFVECFKSLPGLATLCLMGNPVTRQIFQYRRTLIASTGQ